MVRGGIWHHQNLSPNHPNLSPIQNVLFPGVGKGGGVGMVSYVVTFGENLG